MAATNAAAAERQLAILAETASHSTSDLARQAIDALWAAAGGVPYQGPGVDAIGSTDEASIDDSHRREYVAMRCLQVVAATVAEAVGQTFGQGPKSIAANVFRSLDGRANSLPGADSSQPDRLLLGELEHQRRDRQIVDSRPRAEAIKELRDLARTEGMGGMAIVRPILEAYRR